MLKEFAWRSFEKTGSIDAYFFYKEVEERSKALKEAEVTEEEVAASG